MFLDRKARNEGTKAGKGHKTGVPGPPKTGTRAEKIGLVNVFHASTLPSRLCVLAFKGERCLLAP